MTQTFHQKKHPLYHRNHPIPCMEARSRDAAVVSSLPATLRTK